MKKVAAFSIGDGKVYYDRDEAKRKERDMLYREAYFLGMEFDKYPKLKTYTIDQIVEMHMAKEMTMRDIHANKKLNPKFFRKKTDRTDRTDKAKMDVSQLKEPAIS